MDVDIKKARELLKAAFPMTEKALKKMAVYKNKSGMEIAMQLVRSRAFYLWLEKYDSSLEYVSIKNVKNPGQPYASTQPRSSNLNDTMAPRLKVGNKVWYLEVENLSALQTVIDGYKNL